MSRLFLKQTFVLLLLLSFAGSVVAQRPPAPQRAAAPQITGADSVQAARFQLAESLVRAAQFERAIILLEDLFAASPEAEELYALLKNTYEAVKRYDDALALLEGALEGANGLQAETLLSEKARLLYLSGDEQGAFTLWESALDRAADQQHAYLTIYNSLMQVRLLDRAINTLTRGREDTRQPALFQAELAYLYSLVGQHELAMEEYLGLLDSNERQLNYVRNRLNRSLEQEGALEASIAATERRAAEAPLSRSLGDLLAWLYMEAGEFRKAFAQYQRVDRLGDEQGRAVFDFAKKAADAAAYGIALEAFSHVLTNHPETPVAEDAQLGLAEMHKLRAETTSEQLFDDGGHRLPAPHYEAALEGYRIFLQRYPENPRVAEVLRRIGHLQQDVFYSLGEAGATLSEVALRYPNSEAAHRARFDLGRIALARGQLEEARVIFSSLAETLQLGDLAEQAQYEEALIHFYRGEFEDAAALLSILDENTSTDVANDAIDLRLLLFQNPGSDSSNAPLKAYATASLLLRQRRMAETVDAVDDILRRWGRHPVADEARFLRAQALREARRAEDALLAFGELPLIHPESPLADRSLFHYADILEQDLDDRSAALEAYTDFLARYPGSLLAPEARLRIRALRGEGA